MRYEFLLQQQDAPYVFEDIEKQLCAQGALAQADGSWLWPLAPTMDCWVRRVREGERCFHALGLSMDSNSEKALEAFEKLLGFAQSQGLKLIDAQQLKEVTEKDEASFLTQYGRLLEYTDSYGDKVFAHKPSLTWGTSSALDAHKTTKGLWTGRGLWVFLGLLLLAAFVFYNVANKLLAFLP